MDIAVARALAELDFAPGELTEDRYAVTVLTQPEEGFLGVGGSDAFVEVSLLFDEDLAADGEDLLDLDEEDHEGPDGNVRVPDDDFEDDLDEELEEVDLPAAGSTRLREFLTTMLTALGVEGTIRIVEEVDVLKAEVSGEDLGILIGRRGQTIDSVEYLASLVLYPRPESR